jgi:hypothetical protein
VHQKHTERQLRDQPWQSEYTFNKRRSVEIYEQRCPEGDRKNTSEQTGMKTSTHEMDLQNQGRTSWRIMIQVKNPHGMDFI